MPDILVIKPSSLGDIVHGLQVAEALRRGLPEARIAWIAARPFAPLVRACATVSDVFEFQRRGGVRGFLRLIREIRRRRFDAVLDLQGLARSGLMAACARGTRKFGRADSREGARWLVRERVKLPRGGPRAHALEILLQFLPPFGLPAELHGRLEFRPPADARLAPWLPPGTGKLIVLFRDSRRPEKNWPWFSELTQHLLARRDPLRIVWAGTQRHPLPGWAAAEPRLADLSGRTRVDELPELLGAADLVVANDSGPMHLAAAMGAPVLALFGPTDPFLFGPYPPGRPGNRVLVAPGGVLARLEVDAVARAIEQALAARPPITHEGIERATPHDS